MKWNGISPLFSAFAAGCCFCAAMVNALAGNWITAIGSGLLAAANVFFSYANNQKYGSEREAEGYTKGKG